MGLELRGELVLLATRDGGLKQSLPNGSRSLLLRLAELGTRSPDSLGVVIERLDGNDLAPGTSAQVRVTSWGDLTGYVAQGDVLPVWYGRDVGTLRVGEVVNTIGDRCSA